MSLEGIQNLNLTVDVTVFAPDNRGSKDLSAKIYKGQISGSATDQSFVIQLTTGDGSDFLVSGKPIFLFLAHDLGLYIFSAIIASKKTEEANIVLQCSKPQQVKFFQRRKSVRVNVNIPVNFSTESNRTKVFEGNVTNLSTGGAQLEVNFSIPLGSNLELVYQLEDIGPMFMDGVVVRSGKKGNSYILGVQFKDVDQFTADGIAKFIITEQARQKRLGLQVFKAFILNATIKVSSPTVFSIIQFKNLDISALLGKKCNGIITEIGIHGLTVECPLKLPVGSVLEFSADLPKLGYMRVKAIVSGVNTHMGKYIIQTEYVDSYESIRDSVLEEMAKNCNITNSGSLI